MNSHVLTATAVILFLSFGVLGQTSRARSKPKPKPAQSKFDKPFDTRCGVHYKDFDDFLKEIEQDYWFEVAAGRASRFLYNPTKIMCSDNGILKIWIKEVQDDKTKALAYSLIRYELNCGSEQIRQISQTDYAKDGEVIESYNASNPKWNDVIPESVGETVLNTACRKPT